MPHWYRDIDPGFYMDPPPGSARDFDPGFSIDPPPGSARDFDPGFYMDPGHGRGMPPPGLNPNVERGLGNIPGSQVPPWMPPPGLNPNVERGLGNIPGGNSSFILYAKKQLDEALALYEQVFHSAPGQVPPMDTSNGAGVK